MPTTVRIHDADKRLLDQFQAHLTLATGERMPLEQVLHRILDAAARHAPDWLGLEGPRLSPKELGYLTGLRIKSGRPGGPHTIDEELYGGPKA